MYKKFVTVICLIIYGLSLCLCVGIFHKVLEESVKIPCENSLDCEFNEECNVEHFCQCRSDKNCSDNALTNSIVTTKIGENCHVDSDCNIQDAICSQVERECRCSEGFVVSTSGKLCLKAVHSLVDSCIEDIQCNTNIKNSICLQTICVCKQGMHDYNNTCHIDRTLGDGCQSNAECMTFYSDCQDGTCVCTRRYIASRDKQECLLAANSLLSPCKRDEQCVATLGIGSHCYNDLCNCMYMYQYKATVKKCVKDMTLGEHCKSHSDCHQPGSDPSRLICILNECQCKIPLVQENGNCVESSGGEKIIAVNVIIFFLGALLFKNVL